VNATLIERPAALASRTCIATVLGPTGTPVSVPPDFVAIDIGEVDDCRTISLHNRCRKRRCRALFMGA
jgi:hypothetical protein